MGHWLGLFLYFSKHQGASELATGGGGVRCLYGVLEDGWMGAKEVLAVEDRFCSGSLGRIGATAAAGDSTERLCVFHCPGIFPSAAHQGDSSIPCRDFWQVGLWGRVHVH